MLQAQLSAWPRPRLVSFAVQELVLLPASERLTVSLLCQSWPCLLHTALGDWALLLPHFRAQGSQESGHGCTFLWLPLTQVSLPLSGGPWREAQARAHTTVAVPGLCQ